MNIAEVRELLEKWQQKMGLGAWTIKTRWQKTSDTEHGRVEFDFLHRTATIFLNRPASLPPTITVEYVLVHELIHLVLLELELVEKAKPETKELVLERVVNQLTRALLEH